MAFLRTHNSSYFLDEVTGAIKKEGDKFKIPKFATTLRTLAENGVDVFYNGAMGDKLVEDVQKKNGILTKEDLRNYR